MRYRNQKYLNEIADTDTDEEHVLNEQVDLPVANAEEESWKKRYGDLRRKAQVDATTLENRLKDLEAKLNAAKAEPELPRSPAEVEQWMRDYPHVAGIIETMIIQKIGGTEEKIRASQAKLDQMEHERALGEALNELLQSHPDFLDIRSTVEFADWTQDQPKWVNKALYDEDEIDTQGAIRAIDLYKSDMAKLNKNTKAAQAPARDNSAATSVRTPRSEAPTSSNNGEWTESRVAAMGHREYEKHEEAIEAAIRAGKFVYDITAGAR